MPIAVARTEYTIKAPPERVFAVLSDGWTYADWVVGTAHIRDVDPGWPEPGTAIHHKVGPWPLSVQDRTVSLVSDQPRALTLKVRMWPLGEACVAFTLVPHGASATRVVMTEDFTGGPLRWVRTKLNDLALHGRNKESLRRLSDLATRRDREPR